MWEDANYGRGNNINPRQGMTKINLSIQSLDALSSLAWWVKENKYRLYPDMGEEYDTFVEEINEEIKSRIFDKNELDKK